MSRLALLTLVLLALPAGAVQARADDHGGGDEVRVAGTCSRGAASSLRVRAHDEGIETRFRLRQTRGRGVWRIAIVHEHRLAARATRKTTRSDASFELRRRLADFDGSDTVAVRAWGPGGRVCRASATLSG